MYHEVFSQMYNEPGQQIILREEHGVLFERLALMEVAASKWRLVLAVEMPGTAGLKTENKFCTKQQRSENAKMNMLCSHFTNVLQTYESIEAKIVSQLNEQRREMYLLLPQAIELRKTRSRRAFLSFIGDLSQILFGTVSERSFNKQTKILWLE